jgi:hypothetical protein
MYLKLPASRFSRVVKLLRFFLLAGGIAFFSYCSTSPKTASSFGKRKYTKGYFSDPVAKLKMDYTPFNSIESNTSYKYSQNTYNQSNNIYGYPVTTDAKNNFTVPRKQVSYQNKTGGDVDFKRQSSLQNNTSVKECPAGDDKPSDGYNHRIYSGPDSTTYLVAWLTCLGIALLIALLAAAAGSGNLGCFLTGIGVFAFIAAVIFFVLWLVAIAHM